MQPGRLEWAAMEEGCGLTDVVAARGEEELTHFQATRWYSRTSCFHWVTATSITPAKLHHDGFDHHLVSLQLDLPDEEAADRPEPKVTIIPDTHIACGIHEHTRVALRCMDTHTHTRAHTHTLRCMDTHTHAHTHTHTHTHADIARHPAAGELVRQDAVACLGRSRPDRTVLCATGVLRDAA
eukprot:SAG22_NODE_4237_length_1331_cov_3.883117_1_plen_181_part_10